MKHLKEVKKEKYKISELVWIYKKELIWIKNKEIMKFKESSSSKEISLIYKLED